MSVLLQVDGATLRGNPLKNIEADMQDLLSNKDSDMSENTKTGEWTRTKRHIGGNPLQNADTDLFEYLFNKDVSDNLENTKPGETTQIRKHFLYNMCSEKLVKIFRKGRRGINARGKSNSKNTDFSK